MRVFIGAFLSAENQGHYQRVVGQLRSRFPGAVRPVPDGSVHVTLAFLPHVDEGAAAPLSSALERVAATSSPIAITLEPPDVLWGGRVPRLIEAKVGRGSGEVMRLVRTLAATIGGDLPSVEIRPAKSAHATLARFRRSASAGEARRVAAAIQGDARHDAIDRVAMVSSQLTSSGAIYTVMAECALGSVTGGRG